MENETELEEAKRARREAEADKNAARERLLRYEASNPGAMDAGQLAYTTSLNNMVTEAIIMLAEATSRLQALESNKNQSIPGNYTGLNKDNQRGKLVQQQSTELSAFVNQEQAQFAELNQKLDMLNLYMGPLVQEFMRKFYYTSDKMTDAEKPSDFKMKLMNYYYGNTRAVTSIVCMFSKVDLPYQTIIGCHIFKSCLKEYCMDRLSFEDIDDERNGLLLFKPFQFAFDNSHICFLYNSGQKRFAMKILHPDIKGMTLLDYIVRFSEIDTKLLLQSHEVWRENFEINEKMSPVIVAATMKTVENLTKILQTKWKDYENNFLDFGEEKCFDRCLSFQAGMARYLAIDKGWIQAENMNLPNEFSDVEESKVQFLSEWRKGIEQIPTIDAE